MSNTNLKCLTIEEKIEKVKNFRLIDDVFFEVFASDKKACEEILRVIMEDPNLTVLDVIVQSDERNLYGKSVRLDALCTLGDGTKCNIEVQRSNNDNHLKRVRYNAASITVKDSQTGEKFENVIELYIVYISEFDVFKEGKTIYHVDKTIRETGTTVDDGLHEIFVNTAIDDGSTIADLMNCFTKKEVNNPKFPILTKRFNELKTTEGGVSAMCEVMEKYMAESKAEGKLEQLIELVKKNLLKVADAASEAGMTEEKFKLLLK